MIWSTQLARIRRYLRDPDGDIWSDTLLLRLFNDEQLDMFNDAGLVESVQVVRIPPMFYCGYSHDFEWVWSDYADGEVWQCCEYYDAGSYAFFYAWEPETLAGGSGTSDGGYRVTHPWESFVGVSVAESPPLHAPDEWVKMLWLSYDNKQLSPTTKKELTQSDPTWKNRSGEPYNYYRDENLSNRLFLYPYPSSISWQDTTDGEGDPDTLSSTGIDVDGNLLAVFQKRPTDITATTDESDFAEFIQKYLEYGVLEKAYEANTDGRIKSLAEYWGWRKTIGMKAIKFYKRKRKVDRDYCLTTKGGSVRSDKRLPRLPDAYPSI